MTKIELSLLWVAMLVVHSTSRLSQEEGHRRAFRPGGPPTCCDLAAMPRKYAKCCYNGEWMEPKKNSNGERVYTCFGQPATGPHFSGAFTQPCEPKECSDLAEKRTCRLFYRKGCRWLHDDGKCVDIDNVSCSELSSSKRNCKSLGVCKFRDQTCQPRCKEMSPGSICTLEYFPVGCGGAQCQFGNLCMARAAGYNEKQCKRLCVDGSECVEGDVCYRKKYCSDYSICPRGRCLTPTGSDCDTLAGINCPEREKCLQNPCPPGAQGSCGGFCISK